MDGSLQQVVLPQRVPRVKHRRLNNSTPSLHTIEVVDEQGKDGASVLTNGQPGPRSVAEAAGSTGKRGFPASEDDPFSAASNRPDAAVSEEPARPDRAAAKYEWGNSLEEAFENAGLAMFNYMTPLEGIETEDSSARVLEAHGQDVQSLLFHYLDELLFLFSTELIVFTRLKITQLSRDPWKLVVEGRGGLFDRAKQESGTEIKAITYSAMQIKDDPGSAEVYVIVDI